MATLIESMAYNYALAKREQPKLRKGQYMQRVFPGRYKNEDSAYQAFNQTLKGRRPGRRLPVEPRRTFKLRGKQVPQSYEEGLWKVVIHFNYVDRDGNLHEDEEISFNMRSSEHTNLLAIPYLQDAMLPTAEQVLADTNTTGDSWSNAQIVYLEIIPINNVRVQPVDIDELYI